ncbi:unnamed protein product [Rotaria sp. Silwood1]|nr:unnamed protein product [Rotaria sp. Silwood1]CAF1631101.1 unnamed protein product [Rotaria sp. Silwood1]
MPWHYHLTSALEDYYLSLAKESVISCLHENQTGATTSVCIEEIALTDLTDLATTSRDEAREASSVPQTMPLINPLNSVHIYIVKQKRQAFFCLMF